MHSFGNRMGDAVINPDKKGYLVSVLELGAWFGVLVTGYLADKLSRKYTIVVGMCSNRFLTFGPFSPATAVVVFSVGVIVQTTAKASPSIYGGEWQSVHRCYFLNSNRSIRDRSGSWQFEWHSAYLQC